MLHWYFTLPILRYCGIWAIQMFVIHVYLIAFFTYFQPVWSGSEKLAWALALQALYMAIPFGLQWQKSRSRSAARTAKS